MIKCEQCGKEITSVEISVFNHDGSDSIYSVPIDEAEEQAVFFDTSQNWTGYYLDEEEQIDRICCPKCGKFPFNHREVHVYDIVQVVMFKTEE